MFARFMLPAALLAALFVTPAAKAQDAPVRIGVCNPVKVFAQMEERKAVEQKVNSERQKIKGQSDSRKLEVQELQKEQQGLKPGSAQYAEKGKIIMEKAVEYEVWARITEAEVNRSEKDQIKALFAKITDASKAVAEQRKLDVIFAERKPDLSNTEQLTPDQVRSLITQQDALYINDKADVTDAVIGEVNKRYAAAAGGAGAATDKDKK